MCVIGAGAAGLVAAAELIHVGHEVTVFESRGEIGGVWVVQEPEDPRYLGDTGGAYSSMYDSLRTNLPRDLMAFLDYRFDGDSAPSDDRRFPHYSAVREYLENFAVSRGLMSHIQLNTRVSALRRDEDTWLVSLGDGIDDDPERFDAVAVCSGHYARPRVPALDGADGLRGLSIHSHTYRVPGPFAGLVVAILGTGSSGHDLAYEISTVADHVYWCGRPHEKIGPSPVDGTRLELAPMIERIDTDRSIRFVNGERSRPIDALIYCTGYDYSFPFLEECEIVRTGPAGVEQLYRQLVAAEDATLAFMGLPLRIIPFPLMQYQARWFARGLAELFAVPDRTTRVAAAAGEHAAFIDGDALEHHLHDLGPLQFDYIDSLADESGDPPLPAWYRPLAYEVQQAREDHPADFRDRPLLNRGF